MSQQHLKAVDLFEWNEVDRSPEEIRPIRIGTAAQEQLGQLVVVIVERQLQWLLDEQTVRRPFTAPD